MVSHDTSRLKPVMVFIALVGQVKENVQYNIHIPDKKGKKAQIKRFLSKLFFANVSRKTFERFPNVTMPGGYHIT